MQGKKFLHCIKQSLHCEISYKLQKTFLSILLYQVIYTFQLSTSICSSLFNCCASYRFNCQDLMNIFYILYETQSILIYNFKFLQNVLQQRLISINMPKERANTKSKGDFSIRRELFTSKALGFLQPYLQA